MVNIYVNVNIFLCCQTKVFITIFLILFVHIFFYKIYILFLLITMKMLLKIFLFKGIIFKVEINVKTFIQHTDGKHSTIEFFLLTQLTFIFVQL